jgi:hypothetical protein
MGRIRVYLEIRARSNFQRIRLSALLHTLVLYTFGSKMAGRSDEEKIRVKLAKIYSQFEPHNGCMLPTNKRATMANGYLRYFLRYPGEGPCNTTLHRAVYVLEKRAPEVLRNKAAGQVSHRCGNKTCINISHLVLEQPSQNCDRRRCHLDRKCYGHEGTPECVIVPDD